MLRGPTITESNHISIAARSTLHHLLVLQLTELLLVLLLLLLLVLLLLLLLLLEISTSTSRPYAEQRMGGPYAEKRMGERLTAPLRGAVSPCSSS